MTIKEYLELHIKELANERGWDCKHEDCPSDCRYTCETETCRSNQEIDCRPSCKRSCFRNCDEKTRAMYCPRMQDYIRYMDALSQFLKTDMAEVSFDDVKFALNRIREEYGYAEATMRGIQSCISVIYSFAQTHSGIDNIMSYTSFKGCQKDIMTILISGRPEHAVQLELQQQREKYRYRTKSLTTEQLEKLTRILWDSIEDDGRYCMIALMLYTGIRPAEGRALMWKDIVPFFDHPDRWILNLYKIRDKKGTLKEAMKTPNAFRRIPVHCELMTLLKKRRDYVIENSKGADISNFPVCCLGNNFKTPCLDYEVSKTADKVFSSGLKLKQEDMYIFMLEAELEKLSCTPVCADKDQQLTLYVLRRAFWTWCESLTQLTDFEKRYIMGHEMKNEKHSVHAQYNDENLLWSICKKLDHCVISKNLHEEEIVIEPKTSSAFQVDNRGLVRIHLTRDLLAKGGVLQGVVTSEEAGELLVLESLSALRKYGKLIPQVKIFPVPMRSEPTVGINCEYENYVAHEKYAKSDAMRSE